MVNRSLPREAYALAIICALVDEMAAMKMMLDEEHENLAQESNDPNSYTFGSIGSHNVVIACLPNGHQGKSAATAVALHMTRSFPVKLGLMVGIGGGVPSQGHDIRLGDVVVSMPVARHEGVVQYDLGRMQSDGFQIKGHLDKPPKALLSAVTLLRTKHIMNDPQFPRYLEAITSNRRMARTFGYQGRDNDRLFSADAVHPSNQTSCAECETMLHIVPRPDREDDTPQVFYGTIGSGDMVMKDGLERDARAAAEGVLCFEMEAAGLMNDFPCLVIRGISDYADSHKNDRWQPCAAASAAAYAKELLSVVKVHEVESLAVAGQHRVDFDHQDLPTKTFLNRSEQMLKLEKFFLDQDLNPKRRRAFSVHGPAGTGKTQLCAEFGRRYHGRFTAIFWLDASSEDALRGSFVDIALRLPPDEISSEMTRKAKENPPDKELVVLGVLEWLSLPTNSRWLLIIDNADRECGLDRTDPQHFDIRRYWPKVNHGNLLVTSAEPFQGSNDDLKIPPCNRTESQAILEAVGGEKVLLAESNIVQGLLDRIEGYPLALKQAGAYLSYTSKSIVKYLKGRHQVASNLLRLWGFLNGSDFWYNLVARVKWLDEPPQHPQLRSNIQVPQWLRSLASNEIEFDRALQILTRIAELFKNLDERDLAIELYNQTLPGVKEVLGSNNDTVLDILSSLGRLYHLKEDYTAAERVYRQALAVSRQTLGRDHATTLSTSHTLAQLCYKRNNLQEAVVMYKRGLVDYTRIHGEDHQTVIACINNLAICYDGQGKFDKAIRMYRKSIAGNERIYGDAHPKTLEAMRNLRLLTSITLLTRREIMKFTAIRKDGSTEKEVLE
ncbi:purine and uridine phosphorylase [Aureobasidium sp. EXF-8845]|nr:purine and uridine phosphorylase [Aureobasidium sp. EXF-8845]KAI4848058.1 purine and uridine phosphorylase [Aureobasidium sp. EXF-8846]